MAVVESLTRTEIKRMLLDAVTDGELQVLIDHAEEQRASLMARQFIAPADAADRTLAITVDVTLADFREEARRRASLPATQRRAEEVARKS